MWWWYDDHIDCYAYDHLSITSGFKSGEYRVQIKWFLNRVISGVKFGRFRARIRWLFPVIDGVKSGRFRVQIRSVPGSNSVGARPESGD